MGRVERMVWIACALALPGCAVQSVPGADDAEVASSEQALLGSYDLVSCNATEARQIENALRFGRAIAASPEYQACVRESDHTPCMSGEHVDLEYAVTASQSANDVRLECASLPTGVNGRTLWWDQHDYDYAGSESFLLARAMLASFASGRAFDSHRNIAGTVWHEAMHVHGYEHGENQADGLEVCDGGPDFVWNVTTVPYIIGRCMRSAPIDAIRNAILAADPGATVPDTDPRIDTAADLLAAGWGLDDVTRHFAGIVRQSRVERLPFGRDDMHDVAFASARLDAIDGLERIAVSAYNPFGWPGTPALQLAVGRFCRDQGCTWDSRIQTVPVGGFPESAGVASADMNGDGRDEIIVSTVSSQDGHDDFWAVVGFDCGSTAGCTWGAATRLPSGGSVITGARVAAGQLDLDSNVELVLAGVDRWDGGVDYWRYSIGECDAYGRCSFAPFATHAAFGASLGRGDVAMGNLDGDLVDEVVLVAVDQQSGADFLRYAIAGSCSASTCDFGVVRGVSVGGNDVAGGGVAIGDLTAAPGNEILFAAADQWANGNDYFRFVVGDCDGATRDCVFPHAPETLWIDARAMNGADVEVRSVDGNAVPEIIFGGLEWRSASDSAHFVTLTPSDRVRLSTHFGVEPDPSDPGDGIEWARVTGYPFSDLGVAISSRTDVDYFRFTVPSGREVLLTIDFTHANGDLDMALLTPAGATFATSTGVTDHEEIVRSLPAGEHVLKVYGYGGATGAYRVRIRDRYLPTPLPTFPFGL